MKIQRKFVVFVDCDELEEELYRRGLSKEFSLMGDWFDYQDFGCDCWVDLCHWRELSDYEDDGLMYDCLKLLKEMFHDGEKVLVYMSY